MEDPYYTLVEGDYTKKFIADVNTKIIEGYKVAGGICVQHIGSNTKYSQALIKKNPGTTSNGGGKKKHSRRKTRKNRRKY